MGRTQITVTGLAGTTGVAAPAGDPGDPEAGNSAANPDGRTVLVVENTGAATRNLAVQFAVTVDGQQVTLRDYAIPAGETRYIGPFPDGWYGTDLRLNPDSDELEIAALRLGVSIPATDTTGQVAFWQFGDVAVADDTYPGIDTSGSVLLVDTDSAPAAVDGDILVINV